MKIIKSGLNVMLSEWYFLKHFYQLYAIYRKNKRLNYI